MFYFKQRFARLVWSRKTTGRQTQKENWDLDKGQFTSRWQGALPKCSCHLKRPKGPEQRRRGRGGAEQGPGHSHSEALLSSAPHIWPEAPPGQAVESFIHHSTTHKLTGSGALAGAQQGERLASPDGGRPWGVPAEDSREALRRTGVSPDGGRPWGVPAEDSREALRNLGKRITRSDVSRLS